MLDAGDPRGLLHLQDAGALRRAASDGLIGGATDDERPLLAAVRGRPQDLPRLLAVETRVWRAADAVRLAVFREAGTAYFRALFGARGALSALPLREQHAALRELAGRYLPAAPLEEVGQGELWRRTLVDVEAIFPGFDRSMVPAVQHLFPAARRDHIPR